MKNRLQFVHCDTLFKTSQEAKDYVLKGDLVKIKRPALFAEPMVLKYGEESNPNIILAIGSVGDGVTHSTGNKVFFIDLADVENSLAEINESINNEQLEINEVRDLIAKVIDSCGFNENGDYIANETDEILSNAKSLSDADNILAAAIESARAELSNFIAAIEDRLKYLEGFDVKSTDTIEHELVEGENCKVLSSNVRLSDYMTVGKRNLDNVIIKQDNGLYANVRLGYNEEENKLTFGVNDKTKEILLPKENHVVEGAYDHKTESIILTFKEPVDGEKNTISIDVSKLIGEWTVLGEWTDSPVILKKTPVKSDDILHGAESYQDILTADVRIASEEYKPNNILKKTEDNKYLYVDGTAENITYWKDGKRMTVKDALDSVEDEISAHDGNIIYRKEDGIFADVELEYVAAQNKLKFTKTNKDGEDETKYIELNNVSFLENIYYDSTSEVLVIQYKDAKGDLKEIRVPVSNLFDEWGVENTFHTVTLTKTEHKVNGKDMLSADVNIAETSDNILRVVNHGLHVKGTADNIKYENGTVKDALDSIVGSADTEGSIRNLIKKETEERVAADASLQGLIEAEKNRADAAEKALDTKIAENAKAINDEYNRAVAAEAANKSAIDSENLRATSEEKRIETKFDEIIKKKETVDAQLTEAVKALRTDIDAEVKRSTEKDKELDVAFNAFKENSETKHTELVSSIEAVKDSVAAEQAERMSHDEQIGKALQDEIIRSTEKDIELNGLIESNKQLIESESKRAKAVEELLTQNIDKANANIETESERAKSAEKTNADAIVALEKKTILNVTNSGTVDLAKNAAEDGNGFTLSAKVNVAAGGGNIINSDGSALKATVDLVYDGATNVLTLKTSNQPDKAIQLNSGSIIDNISYDANTKELIISYETADGNKDEVRVNVSDLFNEISVENPAENAVTLTEKNNADGTKTITADVNVATEPNNLLIKSNGNLYVSNQASGIKFEDGKSLVDKINELNKSVSDNQSASDTKYAELDGKISTLNDKVADNSNKITSLVNKDAEIDTAVADVKSTLSQEITERKAADTALDSKITALDGKVADNATKIADLSKKDGEIDTAIAEINSKLNQEGVDRTSGYTELNTKIDAEIKRATEKETALESSISVNTQGISDLKAAVEQNKKDATCSVKNTENLTLVKENNPSGDGYTLSGKVVVSTAENNIINQNGALYASVDLSYNSSTNRLTLLTSNGGNKEIQLSVGQLVKEITYNDTDKQLELTYLNANQKEEKVAIPVTDLYNEWTVEDRGNSVIQLTKITSAANKPDVLKAELILATPETGNLLENANGGLYASNKAEAIKLPAYIGVGEDVETAIEYLNRKVTDASSSASGATEVVERIETTVNEHTTLIQNNKTDIDNLKNENTQIKNDINNVKNDIEDIQTDVNAVKTDVASVKDDIQDVKTDVETVKNDIVTVKGDIADIKSDITEIQGDITNIEGDITEIKGNITNINNELEDLKAKTNIVAEDTNSVDITFTSNADSSNIKADVKVSAEEGNSLSTKNDGLYVEVNYDFGEY